MRCPFGDTGAMGEMPPLPAAAEAASASAPASNVGRTSSLRRTDGWHSTKVGQRARVDVPAYVTDEFQVFLNGVPQVEGRDYERDGRTLWFERRLAKEGRLGPVRWLSMLLGIAGTYRQNDSVDIAYESGGKRLVAADLPIRPDAST
jgi:hypothetical protein